MEFRKKPVTVEAFTWDEFLEAGREYVRRQGRDCQISATYPWSFEFRGHPITHETDTCYLIPTLEGVHHMTPADMLIVGVKGEIYPCKLDIFAATYNRIYEPHQARVVDEKCQLDTRREALKSFIDGSAIFKTLPDDERGRLIAQYSAMTQYSSILADRIAAF